MVMCLDCGHFQRGVRRGVSVEPIADRCERCGGTSFEQAGDE